MTILVARLRQLGGACACCAVGVLLCGCGGAASGPDGADAADGVLTIAGVTMGTYFRVTVAAPPASLSAEELRVRVEARLGEIDARMSTFDPDSEISRFNASDGTGWYPVAGETALVVAAALEIFEQSGGAFDVTVEPLVDLWGFGAAGRGGRVPGTAEIEVARAATGAAHLAARLSPPALRKAIAALRVDLSGIAKGYAVDSVAGMLVAAGAENYLVDIGGEMRAGGAKAGGAPWRIAIERPEAGRRTILRTTELDDLAIATSGDYRNFFEVDGQRYSHEIDPRTGLPIRHGLVLVSVLDASCMRADAWATALIVLGPEAGRQLAEAAGLAAFFVVADDGALVETATAAFGEIPTHH